MSEVVRARDALMRRVGSDWLVATRAVEVTELTGGASAVWALLEEPRTTTALIAELADLFAVDTAVIASEVETCVVDLTDRGLLEVRP